MVKGYLNFEKEKMIENGLPLDTVSLTFRSQVGEFRPVTSLLSGNKVRSIRKLSCRPTFHRLAAV